MDPAEESSLKTVYQNLDKLKDFFGSIHSFMDAAQSSSRDAEHHSRSEGGAREVKNRVTAPSPSKKRQKPIKIQNSYY